MNEVATAEVKQRMEDALTRAVDRIRETKVLDGEDVTVVMAASVWCIGYLEELVRDTTYLKPKLSEALESSTACLLAMCLIPKEQEDGDSTREKYIHRERYGGKGSPPRGRKP